jgi:hypothetical protein
MDVRDGFDGNPNKENGRWNPSGVFGYVPNVTMGFDRKGIQLLKLHGSLNWRMQKVTAEIERVTTAERVPTDSREYLDNVLLYPAAKGEPTTEPYVSLFAMFRLTLSNAYTCFVIGYKFRDAVINSCLNQFLQDDRKAMFALSPHADDNILTYFKPSEAVRKRIRTKNEPFCLKENGWVGFASEARKRGAFG